MSDDPARIEVEGEDEAEVEAHRRTRDAADTGASDDAADSDDVEAHMKSRD